MTIESPHLKISEKLQKEIQTKFTQLGKMYDRVHSCDVVLKKEKNDRKKNYVIEARLLVPRELLFATERAETFEIALEKLTEAVEHQLRRHKKELEDAR